MFLIILFFRAATAACDINRYSLSKTQPFLAFPTTIFSAYSERHEVWICVESGCANCVHSLEIARICSINDQMGQDQGCADGISLTLNDKPIELGDCAHEYRSKESTETLERCKINITDESFQFKWDSTADDSSGYFGQSAFSIQVPEWMNASVAYQLEVFDEKEWSGIRLDLTTQLQPQWIILPLRINNIDSLSKLQSSSDDCSFLLFIGLPPLNEEEFTKRSFVTSSNKNPFVDDLESSVYSLFQPQNCDLKVEINPAHSTADQEGGLCVTGEQRFVTPEFRSPFVLNTDRSMQRTYQCENAAAFTFEMLEYLGGRFTMNLFNGNESIYNETITSIGAVFDNKTFDETDRVILTWTPGENLADGMLLIIQILDSTSTQAPTRETTTTSSDEKKRKPIWYYIVASVLLFCSTIILLFLFIFLRFRAWATKMARRDFDANRQNSNKILSRMVQFVAKNEYRPFNTVPGSKPYTPMGDDVWEVDRDELFVSEHKLGSGAYAVVYKGQLKGVPPVINIYPRLNISALYLDQDHTVAIKMAHLKANEKDKADLLQEIEFMKTLEVHPHILTMLGCSKDPNSPLIITQLCSKGDLLNLLRKSKEIEGEEGKESIQDKLTDDDLVPLTWQISDALNYLSSRKMIHRDVAARNVLLAGTKMAKLSDFGLCRLSDEMFYTTKGGKLPIKWMAPESLEFGVFTEKTDVWSFGVFLYEVFTYGAVPYIGVDPELMLSHLKDQRRMHLPDAAPETIKSLFNDCHEFGATERPGFCEIQEILYQFIDKQNAYQNGYLDFHNKSCEFEEEDKEKREQRSIGRQ